MRYFLIEKTSSSENIGLVLHDPLTTHYIVKTSSESFRNAFEDSSNFLRSFKMSKESNKGYLRPFGLYDYDWAKKVLSRVCMNTWKVTKTGDVENNHELINELIDKYLK